MDDIGIFLILAIAGIIYMIPTWISFRNNHPHSLWIMLINILGGWTGLAWLFLLLWAMGNNKK